jgi:hypothetical protein
MTEESSSAQARYLDPRELGVARSEGGFLTLTLDGKEYPRAHLYWCFPLSQERRFISVRDSEDRELGILAELEAFDRESRGLILAELESRYFAPRIGRIHSLKEEFGYTYWDVDTEAGRCRFTVQVGQNAVIQLEEDSLLLVDVDGNRFQLDNPRALPPRHLRIVESLL